MQITNEYGLPEPLVNAISNSRYDSGGSYITATGLISPPLVRKLRQLHGDDLSEDAMDRIWSFIGTIGHKLLEDSTTTGIAEERYFAEVAGKKISAQIDNLSYYKGCKELIDYKLTSAWSVVFGKGEWEEQLNIQDYLLNANGIETDKLFICAILRDWDKHKAARNSDYPQMQVVMVQIAKWTVEEQEEFIARRLAMHMAADLGIVPVCTDEERWKKEDQWKVKKEGAVKALKVELTEESAQRWLDKQKDTKKLYIEHFPGSYNRCENYCAVKKFCPEYADASE